MSIELIIAVFDGKEEQAVAFLDKLRTIDTEKEVEIEGATAITHPIDGEARLDHLHPKGKKHGGTYGALTGGLAGLLVGGPIVGVIGAVAGGIGGRAISDITDHGVSEEMINDIEDGLAPGSSALLVYMDASWSDMVLSRLEEAGATVTHKPVALARVEPRSASG